MADVNSDFVEIQLSADGAAMAGENGSVRITAAHLSYQFAPGARVRVLTSEWAKVLSRETLQGKTILELSPPLAPGAAAATSTKAQLKKLQAEEAALQTQIAEGK
jgi:hypothetical protein